MFLSLPAPQCPVNQSSLLISCLYLNPQFFFPRLPALIRATAGLPGPVSAGEPCPRWSRLAFLPWPLLCGRRGHHRAGRVSGAGCFSQVCRLRSKVPPLPSGLSAWLSLPKQGALACPRALAPAVSPAPSSAPPLLNLQGSREPRAFSAGTLPDLVYMLVAQSCPTLFDPVDGSPPGSSVCGIV